jgi:hypothetical protein
LVQRPDVVVTDGKHDKPVLVGLEQGLHLAFAADRGVSLAVRFAKTAAPRLLLLGTQRGVVSVASMGLVGRPIYKMNGRGGHRTQFIGQNHGKIRRSDRVVVGLGGGHVG